MDTQVIVAPHVGLQLPKDQAERQGEIDKYVTASVEMLAGELSQGVSSNFVKLLHFYGQFRKYSARNCLLILLQRPDAARVASYKKWLDLGWRVRKGSKAIWLYAPITKKAEDALTGEMADKIVAWKLVPTFADIDLDGLEERPLPVLWQPLPDDVTHLCDRMIARIRAEGVQVTERRLKAGVQGMATEKSITLSTLIPDSRNKLATISHEYAHLISHFGATAKDKSKAQLELEADAVSFVVLHCIGIHYEFTADYLLSFGVTPDQLRASLTAINGISRRIFKLLEDEKDEQSRAA